MKIVGVILKAFILVATIIYSSFSIFVGYLSATSTGLFGASNTSGEQFAGQAMLVLSIEMVITSLFLFRKKNNLPFIILLISAVLIYFAFISMEGFGNEFDTFFIVYLFALVLLYSSNYILDKKLGKVGKK
jgi:hypothetical protein